MQAETVYVRFADQQEAIRVLLSAGLTCALNADGTLTLPCEGETEGTSFTLDLVFGAGTLLHSASETGTFEGEAVTLTAPTAGFHLSLCWNGPLPEALRPYAVHPAAPAGQLP